MDEQNLDEMEGSTPTNKDSSKNAIENIPRTDDFPEYQSAEKCEVLNTKSNTDRLLQKQAFAMNPPLDQRFLGEATKKAIDLAMKATNLDQKHYYEGACKLYENSIDHFLLALKSEPQNECSKSTIRVKCRQYLNRAEELKILIMDKKSNLLKVQQEGNFPTLKNTFTPHFDTLATLKNIVPKNHPKKKKKKPKNIVEMPKVKKKDTMRYLGNYCCAVNCYNCEGGDVRFFKVMRKKDQIQSEKWIKAIGKVIDKVKIL